MHTDGILYERNRCRLFIEFIKKNVFKIIGPYSVEII